MNATPERYKDTVDVSTLKEDLRRLLENDLYRQKQKTRVKPKQGSKKYRHLRRFIETRRMKKLEKRCTLDPSAQVTFATEFFSSR